MKQLINEPDLKFAGLSLWVHSREFPDMVESWDGNWLDILCRVEAHGAFVEFSGPYLRTDELAAFSDQLAKIQRDLAGDATLDCLEPNLNIKVRSKALGHLEVVIAITPDNLTQSHVFTFEVDQSYLASALSDCKRILNASLYSDRLKNAGPRHFRK